MGKDRSVRHLLLEVYKKITIKRGFSNKKLLRLQSEAELLEGQLKPEVVDKIAEQTLTYIKREEPGVELDQWLG
jgi:hypothetical protein